MLFSQADPLSPDLRIRSYICKNRWILWSVDTTFWDLENAVDSRSERVEHTDFTGFCSWFEFFRFLKISHVDKTIYESKILHKPPWVPASKDGVSYPQFRNYLSKNRAVYLLFQASNFYRRVFSKNELQKLRDRFIEAVRHNLMIFIRNNLS